MKNWESLHAFFQCINNKADYIVLRNYEEFIVGDFNNEHPDIDILCSDRSSFLTIIQSESRSKVKENVIHRVILVKGKEVALDIRQIGDGYYDEKWEIEMLNKRKLLNDFCYVMDDTNYYYSLIYHALVQKNTLSKDYERRLIDMAMNLNLPLSIPLTTKELEAYMKTKGYVYTYPQDLGVITNFSNIDKSLLKKDFIGITHRMIRDIKKRCIKLFKYFS